MQIQSLLRIQREFDKRIEYTPSYREYLLAIRTELFELYNAVECNKWWKSNKGKGKDKILDECADVMAFCFSFINTHLNGGVIFIDTKNVNTNDFNYRFEDKCLLEDWEMLTYIKPDNILDSVITYIRFAVVFTKINTNCSEDEIIEAYKKKMQVNHERQDNHY